MKEVAKSTGISQNNTAAILSAIAPLLLSLLGQQSDEDDDKKNVAVGILSGLLKKK